MKRARHLRAVLSLTLVIGIFLGVVDGLMLLRQREMMLEGAAGHAMEELKVIGTLIKDALERGDYRMAAQFLNDWVIRDPLIVEMKAETSGGKLLVNYARGKEASGHPYTLSESVSIPGGQALKITISEDLDSVYSNIRRLALHFLAYSLIVAALFGLLLWLWIRKAAIAPVEAMMKKLNRAKDTLEEKVAGRTAELTKANEELEKEVNVRKAAEQKLAFSESYLRSIITNEPECVKTIDQDGTILDMNPAGLAMVEVEDPSDLIGKNMLDSVTEEYHEPLKQFFKKIISGEKGVMEFEIITATGKRRWLESHAAPFHDPRGKRDIILAITRDVTEQKKLEEHLRHAQKMEALGTLTGGVAHEFNNILTTIIGYGEFLQSELPKGERVRKYADIIRASAERAARLTQGLLAYSRKQIVHLEHTGLNGIIRKMDGLFSDISIENIRLEISTPAEELNVLADKAQMEQVLINLCANALDAMPGGGTLRIEAERVEMDNKAAAAHGLPAPGGYALISVSDTGTGMEKEIIRKIFEPFFTTKGVGKGTGLGLSMVYGIVQKHRGNIIAQSEPGKGSVFKVLIPLAAEASLKNGETARDKS